MEEGDRGKKGKEKRKKIKQPWLYPKAQSGKLKVARTHPVVFITSLIKIHAHVSWFILLYSSSCFFFFSFFFR
ncbi:hypothetical protein QG37_00400 [Candidozyma auris]|uniref:Uncharacterized protein n=1 Tax=Candidozyma auris TaxID=498019 RepID=A0A0L0P8A6_CANAR|nr:hypothetical protein QG37_00400 [[Candida] auris]